MTEIEIHLLSSNLRNSDQIYVWIMYIIGAHLRAPTFPPYLHTTVMRRLMKVHYTACADTNCKLCSSIYDANSQLYSFMN